MAEAKKYPTPATDPENAEFWQAAKQGKFMTKRCTACGEPHYFPRSSAGFPRPILHGMCTYGITCRGVLQTYADYDPSAFRQHAARFSSPVYPRETVTMEMWKDGNVISFEARVKARNVTVIKSGRTVLG